MDKYLSVITNFGCHYTCPYCIVKNNKLHIPKTTISGLSKLHSAIIDNGCNWVSLSGGGDPLHNYVWNKYWYEAFFSVIPRGVKTELHTSYTNCDYDAYAPFDRVVYHVLSIEDIDRIRRYNGQIVRVVFVVAEYFTEQLIEDIYQKVNDSAHVDELSFRQMVDDSYKTTHYCEEFLKKYHKDRWYYVEQNDYNLYYAENRLSTKYEDFKEAQL